MQKYTAKQESQKYEIEAKAGKAGIDAYVSKRYGYGAVISVMPGGAAAKAGVEGGDVIEAINDKSTYGMSLSVMRTNRCSPRACGAST